MLKRPRGQNSVIFHHLATFACNIYLDFWKEIFTADTETGFLGLPWAYKPHGEKREGRGERGEEKRTAGTHNFYIAHFGDSFWTTKKCSRHTARTPAGTHNFYIAHFGDSFWTTRKLGFFGLPWETTPHGQRKRKWREGRRKKDCWHS